MDIKSKNKNVYIMVLIICVYMFALSALSIKDIINNRNYLGAEPYFNSSDFKNELVVYFNNIKALNGIYKDYSQKSDDEKVTNEELISSKTLYDSNLKNSEEEIKNKYTNDIVVAEKEGNTQAVKRLTEGKDSELNQLKKENTKTVEDMKKEIASYKTKDYENIKSAVKEKSLIKYYIENKTNNVIDTNIVNVSDIDLYVKNNALYSKKFPEQSINNNDGMASINQEVGIGGQAYFIIPKDMDQNNYIYSNYIYYNSVAQRIIKEAIIGAVSFIIGFIMLIYVLKKDYMEMCFIGNPNKKYYNIPLDIWTFIFVIFSLVINSYINRVGFFSKPYNFHQIYMLTIIAFYIYFFILSVRVGANLIKDKEKLRAEVKNCVFNKFSRFMKESPITQSTKFKVRGIIILTLLCGVSILGAFIALVSGSFFVIIPTVYVLCYLVFITIYSFKGISVFGGILKGTEQIVSGNLNYTIEESGKGDFFKLAHNINNMKVGFKKSLENEIKSERLKSELITSVSHDLKTPLTSIINYVDLLKKEGLSKEESQGYIDVLDRKSQRLKILIEDLFEASKMASGAVELHTEKVDVTALLSQSLAELEEKINNSSLIFKLKSPSEKVYANLDGKRTWRVFENLINNILKYSLPKTRVYIELIEKDSKIIITMKNISSYEMDFDNEEIFERFIRGDKSRNTEGSGLGLSIAKSILELQGGTLSIEIDGDLFKAKVTIPSFPK
ncbi:sensor histidine kinase [Clostridium bowmanii]|uniref:sensor histidine kinase n=1 Tax=Clostridium bowmanii TaxID=132925 RepID=UPI001C0CB63B|nr:sensor histidine kinase [Clostridium bowmanii]MBU3188105.1 sensor histidine kinase [Clostridium bowmanii]MCA1072286.1 sensor histidine kinase [Clostridium bowmanii]